MIVLGIDPGLSGALAWYDGKSLRVYDMPVLRLTRNGKGKSEIDLHELGRLLRDVEERPDVAFVELVGAMPGQGVSSMFAFGAAQMAPKAALAALQVRIETVTPQTWKRWHQLTGAVGKDASRARAKNIFPQHSGLFSRVKDDGRAEAALIAHWAFNNSH